MNLYSHGERKYPETTVLLSSEGRGWSGVAAELRAHPVCELPVIVPQQTEVIIAIRGCDQGVVRRTGAGERQQTRASTGTIWLCPVGVGEREISVSAPLPEILHIYLSTEQFNSLAEEHGISRIAARSIRYAAGFEDEMIRQIGLTMLSEMASETAAGRMLIETSALALTARLVHSYADGGSVRCRISRAHGLDDVRLRRVLDYIGDRLEQEITVTALAGVACLSPFHFTRMFTTAMGMPPHHYVSQRRLENARALLAAGRRPLTDIALSCSFSSQASFNRAFRRATGTTPGEYRRSCGRDLGRELIRSVLAQEGSTDRQTRERRA